MDEPVRLLENISEDLTVTPKAKSSLSKLQACLLNFSFIVVTIVERHIGALTINIKEAKTDTDLSQASVENAKTKCLTCIKINLLIRSLSRFISDWAVHMISFIFEHNNNT